MKRKEERKKGKGKGRIKQGVLKIAQVNGCIGRSVDIHWSIHIAPLLGNYSCPESIDFRRLVDALKVKGEVKEGNVSGTCV